MAQRLKQHLLSYILYPVLATVRIMKTVVQFDLIRLGENDYCTDPNTLYVFGFINFNMLKELMTSADYLNDMVEDLEIGMLKTVTMQVWEDSDDYRTWLDYKLLPDDYEVALP